MTKNTTAFRKLMTRRMIKELRPIEKADAIELAVVDGWQVVVKKNEFSVGDEVLYCEVDSALPEGNPQWQFLIDKSSRIYNGRKVHVLRSIKLRGALSQGLILPIPDDLPNDVENLDEYFGIEKYEPPIPAQLQGEIKGNFPTQLFPKTDAERIQNFENFDELLQHEFEITVKLDGSSLSAYQHDGKHGVCSRNLELKLDQEGNTFVDTIKKIEFFETLKEFMPHCNLAFQGELIGPGIQGNLEKLTEHKWFIFSIYDIDRHEYLTPFDRQRLIESLNLRNSNIHHVPVVHASASLYTLGLDSIDKVLHFATGPSMNPNVLREGLVFKSCSDPDVQFKAISNQYLLKRDK